MIFFIINNIYILFFIKLLSLKKSKKKALEYGVK